MRESRVAVVGATGFIGSRLVAKLSALGRPPACFNHTAPPVRGGRAHPGLCEAEVIFFLAAGLTPSLAAHRPDLTQAEFDLLSTVLEKVARMDDPPMVVLASSGGAVYHPDAPLPYRESTPTGPTTAYGRAKLDLERELAGYTGRVRPVALRMSNVYGPGQRLSPGCGVLAHWLSGLTSGQPLRLYGDPHVARDYVHVDDVVELLMALYRSDAEGGADPVPGVLNVGSGTYTTLAELREAVIDVVDLPVEVEESEGRPFDRQSNWLDTSLAGSALGWRATTDLRDGIRRYWEHVADGVMSIRSGTPAARREAGL